MERLFHYQPFYCEENAWWLCAAPELGPGQRLVVFIASEYGLCPFANSRAAEPGELVWWDYHVVVLDGTGQIWDLDTRLPMPLPARTWLAGTFPFLNDLPESVRPRFRVISAEDYRADFASDRSHMRSKDGAWRHPPPPWSTIGEGMTLKPFRDVVGKDGPGRLFDLKEFQNWLTMFCARGEGEESALCQIR